MKTKSLCAPLVASEAAHVEAGPVGVQFAEVAEVAAVSLAAKCSALAAWA